MDITAYTSKQIGQKIINKEQYGTYVEKDKKKKKKKNKTNDNKSKQIDQQKIKQQAKQSQLYNVNQLTLEEKIKYSQAQYHPLKIICSNLPFKITIEQIYQYFNTIISTSNPQLATPAPIKNVTFDKARTFAILTMSSRRVKDFFRSHPQFTYIEGITIFKMIKPKIFFEQKYLKKKQQSTNTADKKLYLGALPLSFMDDQVKKICEIFGKLKFFNLVKDGNVSKGYCFFQYQQHGNADKAIKALNGLPVTTQRLKCHMATMSNKGVNLAFNPTEISITEVSKKPANHIFGSYLLSYQNINDIQIQKTLVGDPLCKVASRVIQLLNMCTAQDLYEDEFIEDIERDIQEECQKYGPIQKVITPRPDNTCGYTVPSVGKIFVKFMYIIHAKKARLGISGLVYNKRTVVVSFYPEEKFNGKQFLVTV